MFENYNQEECHFANEESTNATVVVELRLKSEDHSSSSEKEMPKSTLDETIGTTIKRDLSRIASKMLLIILPTSFAKIQKETIQDWDLWGPFVFYLTSAAFVHKIVCT